MAKTAPKTFEAALDELEKLVADLESGNGQNRPENL